MAITIPVLTPPVSVPNSVRYRTAEGQTVPLTNIEVDQNFAYLHDYANKRLLVSDFTSQNIVAAINSDNVEAVEVNINSTLLRGFAPNTDNVANTLVLRSGFGDFAARNITASQFIGNASTATLAAAATKLETTRKINNVDFDGSSDITIQDSTKLLLSGGILSGRLSLPGVPVIPPLTITGVQILSDGRFTCSETSSDLKVDQVISISGDNEGTGSISGYTSPRQYYIITTDGSTSFTLSSSKGGDAISTSAGTTSDSLHFQYSAPDYRSAPLSIGQSNDEPNLLTDGDIWTTNTGQYNRINGQTYKVVYTNSDISGLSSNVTGIVNVDHGGTGVTNISDFRDKFSVAKSGVNSDITELQNVTSPLKPESGGTGLSNPGEAGNVLISKGDGTWEAASPYYPVTGMVMHFAGQNAPGGWIVADGKLLLKKEYEELYKAVGLTFTETIVELHKIDCSSTNNTLTSGYGTERASSGTGLGQLGGFNTSTVGGDKYLRFGTPTIETQWAYIAGNNYTTFIANYVAVIGFPTRSVAPFSVGDRISVITYDSVYNGLQVVLECTTNFVAYQVVTPARGFSSSNYPQAYRMRWAEFNADATYSSTLGFDAIRGNNSNGGETPAGGSSISNLYLYFKSQYTGQYVPIGTIYPTINDPYATALEKTSDYAADWKTRQVVLPPAARLDNQTFAIVQRPATNLYVYNETYLNNIGFYANGTTTVTVQLYSVDGLLVNDIIRITDAVGTEQNKMNGVWRIASVDPDTLSFSIVVSSPIASGGYEVGLGAMYKSSGILGAADAFGIRNIYFYDLQDENSEQFSFRIPNLLGEFIRGWDKGRGVDPDRPFGSLQSDDVGPHRHELTGDHGTPFCTYAPQYGFGRGDSGTLASDIPYSYYGAYGVKNIYTGYVTADRASPETRPRNVALLPCIKT